MDELALANLDSWTYATVVAIVESKQLEPARFEYRAVLNPERGDPEKLNERLRKTVCAMANTDGGYVIFGVQEPAINGPTPEERIVGIPAGGDHLKELGEKLKGIHLQPFFEATTRPVPLPADAKKVVFAAHIPLSPKRPHEIEGTFYRRNEGGFNEPMDYHQVRDQMLLTEERLRRLTLLRLELQTFKGQLFWMSDPNRWRIVDRLDTTSYRPLLADVAALVDVDLLQKLLAVANHANRINSALDLARAKYAVGTGGDLPRHLDDSVRELEKLLPECEKLLTDEFGPMGA